MASEELGAQLEVGKHKKTKTQKYEKNDCLLDFWLGTLQSLGGLGLKVLSIAEVQLLQARSLRYDVPQQAF